MKRVLLVAAFFSFLGLQCVDLKAQDTNYMRQVLRKLTSEQFHGRGYSFRGDSIAAEYIRGELRRLHVAPLIDNYFQSYTFSTHSMEGPLYFKVDGKKLEPYKQFRVPAWSKSSWGDYKVISVSAEVLIDTVAMQKFLKKNNDLLQDVFVYIDASKWCLSSLGVALDIMKEVNKLRVRNPFNSRGIIVGMYELSTYSPALTDYEHGYSYIEVLASEMPAKVKKINCGIFTQFNPDYQTQNVYGYIPGEVDTMIVYTAHYDHLGTMGDSIVFYGAHDNASGVATVLDIARITVSEKPHYTHVFCFFSGEEAGLKGSKYAADHPVFEFNKVRLLINIDMFCGGNEGIMVFNAETPETKPYYERLKTLNDALEIAPEIRPRANRPNSDHWYFSKHMPAVFLLSMGQRYGGYHDPDDTCDRCGLENYINYVTLISSLAL
ncbi:MAG: M28 family peptidase [Bacteroidales bacterium]|nr:M28 family peptidase [Bacteroidales bacterium]